MKNDLCNFLGSDTRTPDVVREFLSFPSEIWRKCVESKCIRPRQFPFKSLKMLQRFVTLRYTAPIPTMRLQSVLVVQMYDYELRAQFWECMFVFSYVISCRLFSDEAQFNRNWFKNTPNSHLLGADSPLGTTDSRCTCHPQRIFCVVDWKTCWPDNSFGNNN
jgi:hypothetical protein